MPYFFSAEDRLIPIGNFAASRPPGSDPFLGSVSLKEQARLDQEAKDLGTRPNTTVTFTAAERIPNGTRGTIRQDNTTLLNVVIFGISNKPHDLTHSADIIPPTT